MNDTIGFVNSFNEVQRQANENSRRNGFWDDFPYDDDGVVRRLVMIMKLALIHSEISEALEALRSGNPPDDKVPEFTSEEIELADAVIRIMDYAEASKCRLAEAILAKHAYNTGRPYKHGKAF